MKTISTDKCYGGTQGVYVSRSEACDCDMTFAVFVPPQAAEGNLPVLWYLSGLTCTHANVMDKGEYRRLAAELGLVIVCPDTSPRGDHVPDEADNWQFGKGAGFYVDATQPPYAANYRMCSYIAEELPKLIAAEFPVDMDRQGIFGHSMGGHGAITIALKNPDRFRSCSAFAPISHPSVSGWSKPAFRKYLGADEKTWRAYDACSLIEDGYRFPELFVDQGTADSFLEDGLRPAELKAACEAAEINLTLRMQEGYGHSYFFISTFMEDHLRWHAQRLG
ncbi:S-formylglutathione hydrolase [Rhizobium lentis]|uniref:S-formylglutathione hydrolase n=1 Tax=Rhizobium lentis TaxID=1138194 RepID=A0ABS7I961_9HYPH|nr:S-formylglutathione hydrolase [Rhizobium lentis]MBX4976816.1 S-formylglutathione hydrolase [Rhizobium lentis]MBX5012657.1 S-formylglutathione hydrolase [Rhizobium lentis]MBX5087994.1 S-formylglutathione hydrolase [Rhizobium lentis]MBX5101923.1 S-formylglutathione hydrolase [Rhizobium lentis]